MPAGRELDRHVHQKVMGIEWPDHKCPVCGWKFADSADDGCVPDNCSLRPAPRVRVIDKFPRYSSDIYAAWLVYLSRHLTAQIIGYIIEDPNEPCELLNGDNQPILQKAVGPGCGFAQVRGIRSMLLPHPSQSAAPRTWRLLPVSDINQSLLRRIDG